MENIGDSAVFFLETETDFRGKGEVVNFDEF
jgi:hypothetical protein